MAIRLSQTKTRSTPVRGLVKVIQFDIFPSRPFSSDKHGGAQGREEGEMITGCDSDIGSSEWR